MEFQFPVEAGRILSFARSVGDIRPAYGAQLDAAPGTVLTVPPTFVQSGGHFDPAAALYIRAAAGTGRVWGGRADTLHAEQDFEYFEPPRAGDRLLAVVNDRRRWTKDGRSGRLRFVETITEYRTQSGALAVRARKVSAQKDHSTAPRHQNSGTARHTEIGPEDLSAAASETFEGLLVEDLKRSHIAQYAGASGDYNLVHVDENFAVSRAGYPSVIAHGMLTMGLTATFITALIGSGTLQKFGGRFLEPVLPGDSLHCRATATVENAKQTSVSFETLRGGDGAVVFRGAAAFTATGPMGETSAASTTPKGTS